MRRAVARGTSVTGCRAAMTNHAVQAASCSAKAATKKSQSLLFFSVLMGGFLLGFLFAQESRLGAEEFHGPFEVKGAPLVLHAHQEMKRSLILAAGLLQDQRGG